MSYPTTTFLPHLELASALSDADAAALSKISNSSQVWAWTQRTVATNSIAPINDLPPEILQMVFAYVQPSEETSWSDPVDIISAVRLLSVAFGPSCHTGVLGAGRRVHHGSSR